MMVSESTIRLKAMELFLPFLRVLGSCIEAIRINLMRFLALST